MTYRIRITERARKDLDRLLGLLSEHSPEAAHRLADRFDRAISRLETFPLSCGLARENPRSELELRHLLFWLYTKRKYRALFAVRDDEVVILAIRAPGEKDVRPEDFEG